MRNEVKKSFLESLPKMKAIQINTPNKKKIDMLSRGPI